MGGFGTSAGFSSTTFGRNWPNPVISHIFDISRKCNCGKVTCYLNVKFWLKLWHSKDIKWKMWFDLVYKITWIVCNISLSLRCAERKICILSVSFMKLNKTEKLYKNKFKLRAEIQFLAIKHCKACLPGKKKHSKACEWIRSIQSLIAHLLRPIRIKNGKKNSGLFPQTHI